MKPTHKLLLAAALGGLLAGCSTTAQKPCGQSASSCSAKMSKAGCPAKPMSH